MDFRIHDESSPNPPVKEPSTAASRDAASVCCFAGFEFDPSRGELRRRHGSPIPLRPKADALLRQFLTHPGHLLSRDALIAALWPQTVVTDDSLVQCVGELRAALDDRAQRIIRTVPRRGYRFDARVEPGDEADAGAEATLAATASTHDTETSAPLVPSAALPWRPPSRAALGALAGALVVLALAVFFVARPEPVNIDQALARRATVAVLPFAVSGSDPSAGRAADAIADEVAAQLATRVGMRGLGRAVTAGYAGSAPQLGRLARELKATHAVLGRVDVPVADQVEVDVSLVKIDSGEVLWHRRFVRPGRAVPSRGFGIGEAVVNAVRTRGDWIAGARPDISPSSTDPADLAVLGWLDLDRSASLEDIQRARGRFEAAFRADAHSILVNNGFAASCMREDALPGRALAGTAADDCGRAVERARMLAPEDPTALQIWAAWQIRMGRAELALPAAEKANRRASSYAGGQALMSRALLMLGRPAEARAAAELAIELGQGDPIRTAQAYTLLAEIALMEGNATVGREAARRAVVELPSHANAHAVLAAAEALAGNGADASVEMARYRAVRPGATVTSFDIQRRSGQPDYLLGRQRLYEGLRRAGLPD